MLNASSQALKSQLLRSWTHQWTEAPDNFLTVGTERDCILSFEVGNQTSIGNAWVWLNVEIMAYSFLKLFLRSSTALGIPEPKKLILTVVDISDYWKTIFNYPTITTDPFMNLGSSISPKTNIDPKMMVSNRGLLLQEFIFRCNHLSIFSKMPHFDA